MTQLPSGHEVIESLTRCRHRRYALPDGDYVIHTKYKKDFQTVLSDTLDFSISCPERTFVSVSWLVFLAASIVIVVLLVIRSWRRKRDDESIESLKKKLRDLG